MARLEQERAASCIVENNQPTSTRLAARFMQGGLFTVPSVRGARLEVTDSIGREGMFGSQVAMGSPRCILPHSIPTPIYSTLRYLIALSPIELYLHLPLPAVPFRCSTATGNQFHILLPGVDFGRMATLIHAPDYADYPYDLRGRKRHIWQ